MGAEMNPSRKIVMVLARLPLPRVALLAVHVGGVTRAQATSRHRVPRTGTAGALPEPWTRLRFNNPIVQNATRWRESETVPTSSRALPCDRGFGHESLLDCYVGKHAAVCSLHEGSVLTHTSRR